MALAPVIYVITNTTNGKQYVGQTRCGIKERWRKHWRRAESQKGACRAIAAAIRKYGKDSFEIRIEITLPQDATQDVIDMSEASTISNLNTMTPNGYNLRDGGKGGRPSKETIALRSAALKGRKLSEEHRRRLSESQSGRKRTSPAEIAGYKRNAESRRGVPRSQKAIENMVRAQRARSGLPRTEAQKAAAKRHSELMKSRTTPPEVRIKQSSSLKEYYKKHRRSEETCRKLSEVQKGRVFSEETRKKMSAARRRYLECQLVLQKT